MNKPIIMWEKWKDPYGNDDAGEIQNMITGILESKLQDNLENEEDIPNNIGEINLIKNKIPMMITPMGLIPYTENTACSKIFNFWVGHANFNITTKISSIIESIDGVESLDIFTRYRFRIGIGKAFKDSDVIHNINSQIYSLIE